jgi:hypothetical protein
MTTSEVLLAGRCPMKCPVCAETPKNFREHPLQHVSNGEAYAVENFDPQKGSSRLTLYAITEPLSMETVQKLRQRFENATTTVIYSRKLRMMARRVKLKV